jgi:hypothetical protein
MAVVIAIIIDLAIIYAVGKTAENKGRNPLPWMALALFISFFAFLPLLAMGETDEERVSRIEEEEEIRGAAKPVAQIRELGELRDAGTLSQEEFDAKKAELLSRL